MSEKDKSGKRFPDWAPDNAGNKFASRIVTGTKINTSLDKVARTTKHQVNSLPDIAMLYSGIVSSDRTTLSKAITLIESNSSKHFQLAQGLIKRLIPHSGNSIRIGITGVPGAGKSTFIETFGTWLIEQGHKVAVLAIDPSSTISKGSILGDKTRMEKLSRLKDSFIRPSPSSGVLGGVARKTRETIIACEAAGYDIILIETVGVGQSEVTVRSIVDFFLLLQITGAGDELQGIKKGIIELADLIVVNKADGDNVLKAETAKNELVHLLHYLRPATEGWETKALTCSALLGTNITEMWEVITEFQQQTKTSGEFEQRRTKQKLEWLDSMLHDSLTNLFFANKEILEQYEQSRMEILKGNQTPAVAASILIELFKQKV